MSSNIIILIARLIKMIRGVGNTATVKVMKTEVDHFFVAVKHDSVAADISVSFETVQHSSGNQTLFSGDYVGILAQINKLSIHPASFSFLIKQRLFCSGFPVGYHWFSLLGRRMLVLSHEGKR